MILKSMTGMYLKTRPKAHRLEGITTKQHAGFVLARLPKSYPMTSQQRKVKDAARSCGIHTGISRSALVTAMRDCMPGKI
jgi:hypothetical protein